MSLKRQAVLAGRWTTLSALVVTFLRLVQVAVLARLLEPSAFGLMAIALSTLTILLLISDLGVSRVIIHYRNLSVEALSTLFWLNLGISSLIAALLGGTLAIMGEFLSERELAHVIGLSCLALPISAIGSQYRALASRDFKFKELAFIEILAAVGGFLVALAMAFSGAGVYALVCGTLSAASIASILAWQRLSQGLRPNFFFNFSSVRAPLKLSSFLLGESILSAFLREVDLLIGGLMASPSQLGHLSVVRDFTLRISNTVVNPVIGRISLPVMAAVQDDETKLRRAYLFMLGTTAAVNFPLYIYILLFSSDLTAVLLGSSWKESAQYLQIYAAWCLVRSCGNPVGNLAAATGKARLIFLWNLGLFSIVPAALLFSASQFGLIGIAWALLFIQIVLFVPMWRVLVYPICGARLKQYIEQLSRPLLASMLSGAIAFFAAKAADIPTTRLLLSGLIFAVAYAAASHLLNRPWTVAMIALLTQHRETRNSQ